MWDVFTARNSQCNLRNENHLQLPVAQTATADYKILNTEVVFCGLHYQKSLKIPTLHLNKQLLNVT